MAERKQSKIDWQCMTLASIKAACTSMMYHVENHEFLTEEQMKELEEIGDRLGALQDFFVNGPMTNGPGAKYRKG
jgi:hypothetical protein